MKIQPSAKQLLSLVLSEGTDENLSEESLFELWNLKREKVIKSLLNFRKRKEGEESWRHSPWKHLMGIKKFNKSAEGKRFHRQLGRFLATRIFNTRDKEAHGFDTVFADDGKEDKHPITTALKRESYPDIYATLTALSSLRTHLYIEAEYCLPSLHESVEIATLVDFAIPMLHTIEGRLFESQNIMIEIDPLAIELLIRLTERSTLLRCCGDYVGMNEKDINILYRECFNKTQKKYSLDEALFVSHVLTLMKEKLCRY